MSTIEKIISARYNFENKLKTLPVGNIFRKSTKKFLDSLDTVIGEISNQSELLSLKNEYIDLLGEELGELTVAAANRGWKSSRIEKRKQLRAKMNRLENKGKKTTRNPTIF